MPSRANESMTAVIGLKSKKKLRKFQINKTKTALWKNSLGM